MQTQPLEAPRLDWGMLVSKALGAPPLHPTPVTCGGRVLGKMNLCSGPLRDVPAFGKQ